MRSLIVVGCCLVPLLIMVSASVARASDENAQRPLVVSAFRDITAFLLETGTSRGLFEVNVNYVKNADEAHGDLTSGQADLVFMSYDDTLSLALEDGYADIEAYMPVHGGILDLCGGLDPDMGKAVVGIDTDSGYARALRSYLRGRFPRQEDYGRIKWVYAGATNLRYGKLIAGEIDATLLNPPYSYASGVTRLVRMSEAVGSYLGVVVNVRKSWLADGGNAGRLETFAAAWYGLLAALKADMEGTVSLLATHYKISRAEASDVYVRLFEPDGLSQGPEFDLRQVEGTEALFSGDTGKAVPGPRTWIRGVK